MTGYWWLSFVDPDRRPVGDRFLGALVIRGDEDQSLENKMQVIQRSHMLGLNPGGEVAFYCIPKEYHERIPSDWIETRLITKTECMELERRWSS